MQDYIAHYGRSKRNGAEVGSGRYPLGSGDRPFQMIKNAIDRHKARKEQDKIEKEEKRKLDQQREEERRLKELEEIEKKKEKEREEHIANREKTLRSGSPEEVLKYQGEFTNQELQYAIDRINKENTLYGMIPTEEKKSLIKTVDKVVKTIDTFNNWANTGTKSYNNFAKIYNSLNESKIIAGTKKPLVTIHNVTFDKGKGNK